MIRARFALGLAAWIALGMGCAGPGRKSMPSGGPADAQKPAAEKRFYKNAHVRRCLQLNKERRSTEARTCWTQLLRRLESDAGFRKASELGDADVAKVRKMTSRSAGRAKDLRRELDRCLNIPSNRRDERLACFETYQKKNRGRLSVAERYEVQAAIQATKRARELAAGNIENTVEHAGRLLGAKLHMEQEGVRIDEIRDGPMAQAGCPEQGIIVALDEMPIAELDTVERIARLEACQERPVSVLVRWGDIDKVQYTRAELSCGPNAAGKRLLQVELPEEICTAAGGRELRLGISWCYLTREGILEVEEVCNGSPADAAGVQPEQQYDAINGRFILGLSYQQIDSLLATYPDEPIQFHARGGALQSPAALTGLPLAPGQAERFWQAVERSANIDRPSGPP